MYVTEGKIREPNLSVEADQGLLSTGLYLRGDNKGAIKGPSTANRNIPTGITAYTRTHSADVICWSGCKDDETAWPLMVEFRS